MKASLLLISIFALLLSACAAIVPAAPPDGQIYALQTGTTFYGIKAALREMPGTFIMMKDQVTVFVWSVQDGWAFIALDPATKSSLKTAEEIAKGANFVNCKAIDDIVKSLSAYGWSRATPDQVPDTIWQGVIEVGSWLRSAASQFTTFVIVPAGATDMLLDDLGVNYTDGID